MDIVIFGVIGAFVGMVLTGFGDNTHPGAGLLWGGIVGLFIGLISVAI